MKFEFVLISDGEVEENILGRRLEWNPEKNVELIRVHPEADYSFMETVSAAVKRCSTYIEELYCMVCNEGTSTTGAWMTND